MKVITIEVKRHVKAYLLARFARHDEYDKPLHADMRTHLGAMVRMAADKPHYRYVRKPRMRGMLVGLEIRLPTSLSHATFSEEKRQMLGEALNRFYVEQFLAYVCALVNEHGNEQKAIESWLAYYDVNPQSWDYEAARRRWRDHRERVMLRPDVHLDGAGSISLDEFRPRA